MSNFVLCFTFGNSRGSSNQNNFCHITFLQFGIWQHILQQKFEAISLVFVLFSTLTGSKVFLNKSMLSSSNLARVSFQAKSFPSWNESISMSTWCWVERAFFLFFVRIRTNRQTAIPFFASSTLRRSFCTARLSLEASWEKKHLRKRKRKDREQTFLVFSVYCLSK